MGDLFHRRLPIVLPGPPRAIRIVNPNSRGTLLPSFHPATDDSSRTNSLGTPASTKEHSSSGREEDSVDASSSHVFNIYARPFVPEALAIINTLLGHEINTPLMKWIDFGTYSSRCFGLDFLLPIPKPIQPPFAAPYCPRDSDLMAYYELYFRFHLEAEMDSQRKENDSYSLFEHEVTPFRLEAGQTTYSIQVPGLRENSPNLEEDDIIQLRQLRYGPGGKILGMQEWLERTQIFRGSQRFPTGIWAGEPAPGWSGIIYNARVVAVQRKNNMLVIRADELWNHNSSLTVQSKLWGIKPLKFNIQFPVTMERYVPMQHALATTQEAFRETSRISHQYQASNSAAHNTSSAAYADLDDTPSLSNSSQARPWLQSMLFPTEANCKRQNFLNPGSFSRPFFDDELNWEQKKAIESICSHNYGTLPFLISGPPGTGKTKTLVEVALQLLNNVDKVSHILFCAPSDPAADMIVQRISAHMKPHELLRLNRPSRTFEEVPSTVLPFCCVSQDKFDIPKFKQLMACKLVVTTCRDASLLLYARMTNSDLYALEHGLFTSIHPYTAQPLTELHWTALLMDEAAQAMEPEALIPLSIIVPPLEAVQLAFEPLFVMAGDDHQLGPRTSLHSSPLKTSLFKRLFTRSVYASHPLARGKSGEMPQPLSRGMLPIARPAFANLICNYRSHSAILAVPSALFYYDTLEPKAQNTDRLASWSEWRGRRWPVLFCNNDSEDELERDFGGWYNVGEAQIACRYAAQLVSTGLVQQNEVCIMSPFKAQVLFLRKAIHRPEYGSLWEIDIGPTEAFQGLERSVVILCTTRSKQRFVSKDKEVDWGIIGLPNRMNVALTRAKFGLIVIGKRDILVEDPNWKAFLDFCDRNGLVAGKPDNDGQTHDAGNRELTRLEKVLLSEERDSNGDKSETRVMGVVIQEDEMWTKGMQATLDVASTDESEYSDEEEEEEGGGEREEEGGEGGEEGGEGGEEGGEGE